ncbi:hypothetical protein PSEUDO8AS_40343 [Pseudomonas sp. 8AS]|nr:hypothetical protein PSEUDO8AS_40343 [Pseudomonas sp. 8AS]
MALRVRCAHLMASGHPAEPIAERADGLGFAHPGDSLFFVCAKKSKQKKAHPGIRPCASLRVPSFRCHSGGRLTRAIPGPLSLSPHPCGSSPCATPPLGLLTGTRAPSCLMALSCRYADLVSTPANHGTAYNTLLVHCLLLVPIGLARLFGQ